MTDQICYTYGTQDSYPYRVVLWGSPDSGYWWLHNVATGRFRKVGKVGAVRTNHFENACDLCRELNRKYALDKSK
jgi:hypothetical protein